MMICNNINESQLINLISNLLIIDDQCQHSYLLSMHWSQNRHNRLHQWLLLVGWVRLQTIINIWPSMQTATILHSTSIDYMIECFRLPPSFHWFAILLRYYFSCPIHSNIDIDAISRCRCTIDFIQSNVSSKHLMDHILLVVGIV